MAKTDQVAQIAPPSEADLKNCLKDYSATIQRAFEQVFIKLHDVLEVSSVPSSTDGNVGDIYMYDNGTNQYLYVKFASGWKRFVPA